MLFVPEGTQMTDLALYVRNKRAKVVLLYEVTNPDGTGSAMRDRDGRIILVSKAGAFLGHAQWFGASAWAETEVGRSRIAYKNPHGEWTWKISQTREEVTNMKAIAKPKTGGSQVQQVAWSDKDAQALTAMFGGHVTDAKITAFSQTSRISRGAIKNMLVAAYQWRRDGSTPVTHSHGNLRVRSDVVAKAKAFIVNAGQVESKSAKRSHHKKIAGHPEQPGAVE